MQNYSTIVGVIELRQQKVSYLTVQKRYHIGSSVVTLIMNRFQEIGESLENLKAMEPQKVEELFYPPENLRHTKDELTLNSAFSCLEDFYDVVVIPPPPRKPKGKPTVENHVRFLETHLIERLKENRYTKPGNDQPCREEDNRGHQSGQLPAEE